MSGSVASVFSYKDLSIKSTPTNSYFYSQTYGAETYYCSTVDNDGNIYIASAIYEPGPNTFNITKLDKNGDRLWKRNFGNLVLTDNPVLYPFCITVDNNSKSVFVGTYYFDDVLGSCMHIVRYSFEGNLIYQRIIRRSSTSSTEILSCVVDTQGQLFITGQHYNDLTGALQGFVSKLNSSGGFVWHKYLNDSLYFGVASVQIFNSAIDKDGDIYVVGNATNDIGATLGYIKKYNTLGTVLWQRQLSFLNLYYSAIKKIVVSGDNNIYVLGEMTNQNNKINIFIAKISSSGNLLNYKVFSSMVGLDMSLQGYSNGGFSLDLYDNLYLVYIVDGKTILIKFDKDLNFKFANTINTTVIFSCDIDLNNDLILGVLDPPMILKTKSNGSQRQIINGVKVSSTSIVTISATLSLVSTSFGESNGSHSNSASSYTSSIDNVLTETKVAI